MTPEIEQKVNEMYDFIQKLKAGTTIPYDVDQAFRLRLSEAFINEGDIPTGLNDAPLAAITAPSGGATVDSNARTAINSIITALENLGLIEAN